MKTNTVRKMMLAFMAVLMVCSAFAATFAETEATALPEGENAGQGETQAAPDQRSVHRGRKSGKGKQESFEDWFEERIEAYEGQIDFSELPENPTDEQVMEFFSKYFFGQGSAWSGDGEFSEEAMSRYSYNSGKHQSGDGKPKGRHGKSDDDDQYDWLEDWFEDKIDARKDTVDFSVLPENPTDDEILDFFRTYFLNGESAVPDEENAEEAPVQPEAPAEEDGSGETGGAA